MRFYFFLTTFCFIFLGISIVSALTIQPITIDFYYSELCGSCQEAIENVIEPLEKKYQENITVFYKDVNANLSYREEMINYRLSYPSIVIESTIKIPTQNLSFKTVNAVISDYIKNQSTDTTFNESLITIPFIGTINTSDLSLPILTITLGTLDSFNPCAFFILIFLLNLLLYMKSRRRMLLVGGIFIFFSGLFYFLFMFILFETLSLSSQLLSAVSLIVGMIAISIGIINIKDFFLFKKGLSLSIPENKKPQIYKQIRNLIKTSHFPAILTGAVILAVTVNFYELLCTMGFPFIYTYHLSNYSLDPIERTLYILAYNVFYIIPLIIILLIFVITLGRMKLSQWGGQKLKLLSGIMIFSFGLIFIIKYQFLENMITPLLLLGFSITVTLIVSTITKKYFQASLNK